MSKIADSMYVSIGRGDNLRGDAGGRLRVFPEYEGAARDRALRYVEGAAGGRFCVLRWRAMARSAPAARRSGVDMVALSPPLSASSANDDDLSVAPS